MSERRRLRCLNIAAKAGATPDNIVKVAAYMEKWVVGDEDPIRAGVPSPISVGRELNHHLVYEIERLGDYAGTCRAHNANIDRHFEFEYTGDAADTLFCISKMPLTDKELLADGWWIEVTPFTTPSSKIPASQPEIDWDRPQLVVDELRKIILLTTGNHDGGKFEGISCGPACSLYGHRSFEWAKSDFVYHGEIPEHEKGNDFGWSCDSVLEAREPDGQKPTYCEDEMRECFEEARLSNGLVGWKHDSFESYLHWKKTGHFQTTEKPKNPGKTENLTFQEAIQAMLYGHTVKRDECYSIHISKSGLLLNQFDAWPALDREDLTAADWQIIEQ